MIRIKERSLKSIAYRNMLKWANDKFLDSTLFGVERKEPIISSIHMFPPREDDLETVRIVKCRDINYCWSFYAQVSLELKSKVFLF
jgi:hypothetical protein